MGWGGQGSRKEQTGKREREKVRVQGRQERKLKRKESKHEMYLDSSVSLPSN